MPFLSSSSQLFPSALQSLIHDRTLDLPDGTRLVRHDRYNAETPDPKVLAIHKDFRIIAIADTSQNQKWLNTDTSSLFHFHEMCQYNQNEIKQISDCPEKLLRVLGFCKNHDDLSKSLSLRAILRISRVQDLSNKRLSYEIERACMSRFLPHNVKKDLQGILKYADLPIGVVIDDFEHVEPMMKDDKPVKSDKAPNVKVPDTIFFANEQQEKIIDSLINDMNNKQDMLLVGNQGVGKNKIVDHMLQKINKPCEYVQLHRDTTVQSLITESKVVSGKLEIGDSALIRALKTGTVLMLDEVDKAPTHITAILKSLVDKQAFTLPDGRVLDFENTSHELDQGFIKVHPDFQMIVLANRPGFPFLGNNFFAVMGDRFSCHVIDNPTKTATLDLLKPYAPKTDVETLKKLVTAFSKLRNLNEESILNYPYSTREIVSIAKHFDAYPNDGIVAALNNVFDFDMADDVVLERVSEVLSQAGIPIVGGKEAIRVQLAEVQKLSSMEVLEINGLNKFDKKSYSVAVRVVGDHDHVQIF